MARRLTLAATLGAALVTLGCGGSSGLVVLSEDNVGFSLECGVTARWEAAVVRNDADGPATVTSVALARSRPGFTLAYARAMEGPANETNESTAKTPLIGLRIPASHNPVDDVNSYTPGWHLVVGIRTPHCRVPRGFRRGDGLPVHRYESDGDGLVVRYRVDGEDRTTRVGGQMEICAAPKGFECTPG